MWGGGVWLVAVSIIVWLCRRVDGIFSLLVTIILFFVHVVPGKCTNIDCGKVFIRAATRRLVWMFMQIYLRMIIFGLLAKMWPKTKFLFFAKSKFWRNFCKKNFAQVLNFTRGTGIPSSIKDFPYFVYIS